MPTPEAYLLTDADRRVLERLLYEHNRFRKNTDQRPNANQEEHEELSSPEVYAAKTPTGGIPALTVFASTGVGDQPGSAECTVLRLLPDTTNPDEMELVGVFTKEVYNLSTEPVLGETWVLIARDKYGTWFVSGTPPTGNTGFPVELTSEYEQEGRGYAWKRMLLQIDGDFVDHPSEGIGQDAHTPDEDEHLKVGTRGWLFASPDAPGELLGTGSGTYSPTEKWVFIPVYRTRVTCEGSQLIYQESRDGGNEWENIEILGDCGTASAGTASVGTAVDVGTGTTPINTAGDGPCSIVRTKTTDCILASGPYNIVYLAWGTTAFNSGLGDDLIYLDQQAGPVAFWFEDGQPHLSVDGLELTHCGDLCFTGGPLTGHNPVGTDTSAACDGQVFTVCIECVECPLYYYCVATSGTCSGTADGTATPTREVMLLTSAEADALGDAVCSGPYNTEEEAEAACNSGLSCADAIILTDGIPVNINIPATVGTVTYWFRLADIQPGGFDYYSVINASGAFAANGSNALDGALFATVNSPGTTACSTLALQYDTCDCAEEPNCCRDTSATGGGPLGADSYIYFSVLITNNSGEGGSFTVEIGQGTC